MRRPDTADLGDWIRLIATAAFAAFMVWLGGFLHFGFALPREVPDPGRATDGIVVLTGGAARLDEGLRLLAAAKARRLFVSGVYPGTGKADMQAMAGYPELFACCVDLGFIAADTAGNAVETAAWLREQGFTSLRVVTAGYHMPRALVELSRRAPGVTLVPHPVFPAHVKLDRWWLWPGTTSLVAGEYQKYVAALLRARGEIALAQVSALLP